MNVLGKEVLMMMMMKPYICSVPNHLLSTFMSIGSLIITESLWNRVAIIVLFH